jgi:hypothetical protein
MRKNRINDEKTKGFRLLTEEKMDWLIENYHNKTNSECAEYLKLKVKTLHAYAYRLNLKKSPEHITGLRRKQAETTNNLRWKK